MTKVKVHIDDAICFNEKPVDTYSAIKALLQHDSTIQEIELTELVKKIEKGCVVSPGIMDNGMSAKDWVEQKLFMIDIDNSISTIPTLTPQEALKICKKNNLIPIFYYFTYSHCEEKPKFRLAFLMNETITDHVLRARIIFTLNYLFLQSDKSCSNADRMFLGTNKEVVICDLEATISIDNILNTYEPTKEESKTSKNTDNELESLKNNFNFLAYLEERNGNVIRKGSNYVMFENCEICGHHRDLVYYYNTNSFNCFGANGCKGGSIIDYIMASEKLTITEAINKFKYELCKLDRNNKYKKLDYITAEELQNKELPRVKFYIDKIMPQGLVLICSVPKMGKSWLALDLCLSISRGLLFLGFSTLQSSCLYLALEDSYNRLKDRTTKLLNGEKAPSNFIYVINSEDINNGLIEQLDDFLIQFPDVKVIVIDTLQKIRGESKSSNVYANDYKELSKIKRFADEKGLCIILIHHLRKGNDTSDVFDRVSGTNGITGTADTTFVLSKKDRSDDETCLSVIGRDVEYNDYMIKFNKDTCKWEMITTLEKYNDDIRKQGYDNDTLVDTIKTLVEENNGTWSGTLKSINSKHKELYGKLYPNEIKIKNEINKLKKLLMYYDQIEYVPASKNPTSKGRIQSFKKQTLIVANVDAVE